MPILLPELDQFVQQEANANRFSGVILITHDGRPIYETAHGFADLAFQVPNRLDTIFNLASITKMFTAVAIVQLAEQGKLDFQQPVAAYLPDYPRATEITIHHLLTHTAGMGDFWNDAYRAARSELRTIPAYLALFRDTPLSFTPGERYQYGNTGYVLLGAIIEQITGRSYYDHVRQAIFEPAGMTHTDFYEIDRPIPNLAVGYTYLDWYGRPHPDYLTNNLYIYAPKGSPANGCYAPAHDLLKFATALRQHRLVSPEYTRLMFTGKVDVAGQPNVQYGYGFFCVTDEAGRLVGHGGRGMGIDAFCNLYLDTGYTIIVLANYDRPAARNIVHWLSERLSDL
jgi:CubicO group peptidase (beta-lactamase class C family)